MTEHEATLEDLRLELWLRRRNEGRILVAGEDGSHVPLMNISDGRLERAIEEKLRGNGGLRKKTMPEGMPNLNYNYIIIEAGKTQEGGKGGEECPPPEPENAIGGVEIIRMVCMKLKEIFCKALEEYYIINNLGR